MIKLINLTYSVGNTNSAKNQKHTLSNINVIVSDSSRHINVPI